MAGDRCECVAVDSGWLGGGGGRERKDDLWEVLDKSPGSVMNGLCLLFIVVYCLLHYRGWVCFARLDRHQRALYDNIQLPHWLRYICTICRMRAISVCLSIFPRSRLPSLDRIWLLSANCESASVQHGFSDVKGSWLTRWRCDDDICKG